MRAAMEGAAAALAVCVVLALAAAAVLLVPPVALLVAIWCALSLAAGILLGLLLRTCKAGTHAEFPRHRRHPWKRR